MSNKIRHPDTCPTCDYFPCRCPGGGADEGKNSKDENPNAEKDVNKNIGSFIPNVNNISNVPKQENDNQLVLSVTPSPQPDASAHKEVEENQNNHPAWCTFFAVSAKQLEPVPSSNLQQDDSTSSTVSMGMSMSASDE